MIQEIERFNDHIFTGIGHKIKATEKTFKKFFWVELREGLNLTERNIDGSWAELCCEVQDENEGNDENEAYYEAHGVARLFLIVVGGTKFT